MIEDLGASGKEVLGFFDSLLIEGLKADCWEILWYACSTFTESSWRCNKFFYNQIAEIIIKDPDYQNKFHAFSQDSSPVKEFDIVKASVPRIEKITAKNARKEVHVGLMVTFNTFWTCERLTVKFG